VDREQVIQYNVYKICGDRMHAPIHSWVMRYRGLTASPLKTSDSPLSIFLPHSVYSTRRTESNPCSVCSCPNSCFFTSTSLPRRTLAIKTTLEVLFRCVEISTALAKDDVVIIPCSDNSLLTDDLTRLHRRHCLLEQGSMLPASPNRHSRLNPSQSRFSFPFLLKNGLATRV